MIKSFADKKTEELYYGKFVIDCANHLEDLRNPPGNKILTGDRKGVIV
jgi:hypothetical protein